MVLAFASPALAHVTVNPKAVPAGSTSKLTLRVPHGCEGSPTTSISVKIPVGVTAVKPLVHAGWEITLRKDEKSGEFASVTWSGGKIPDEYVDEFALVAKLPATAGKTVFFPVEQGCEKGSVAWVAESEQHAHDDKGPQPAPGVKLTK